MGFQQYRSPAQDEEHHKQREEKFKHQAEEKRKKSKRTKLIVYSVLVLVVLGVSGFTGSYFLTSGPYDSFAKCLTEKGAVMYGAISWCQYTKAQANMFGKSFKYVDYRDESELPGLRTRPTWVIDGKWYETVQSFQTLAAHTGCKI